ncbi:MAG: PorT family protein [Bacteroidetes bacterium]|jgi:hypothetical protein|nr:PorT family protein [Bacteroidota bacterium]MBT7144622.1 PorT family protein [Bacteroidota bacterium]
MKNAILLTKILALLLILATNSNLFGQLHVFSPGILLNFNGIHIEGDESYFWNNGGGKIWGTSGISYGAYVSYGFSKKLHGTLELRYIRKGSLLEFVNVYSRPDFENLKLKYIEIPILFGYKGKTKKRNYFLETGISFAKMFQTKLLFDDLTKKTAIPDIENFKQFDVSWIVSYKYHINKNFLLGFRISYSIISIHHTYNLRNFDYGIEFNYLLFKNLK